MPDTEYGITSSGPNIKRLDVILNEMHSDLSDRWGVNTRTNKESLLNHLLTNFADQIAQLWEFGAEVYYSQYPATAEGISLDNAAQAAGVFREQASKSIYPLYCTGIEGTYLDMTTRVSSSTSPTVYLTIVEGSTIGLDECYSLVLTIPGTLGRFESFSVSYRMPSGSGGAGGYTVGTNPPQTKIPVLSGLLEAIVRSNPDISGVVDIEAETLTLVFPQNYKVTVSSNMSVGDVTTIINFETDDYGDIYLPDNTITKIVNGPQGFTSVTNSGNYIHGSDAETDDEFRQSYTEKILKESSTMAESIKVALLNINGVYSAAVYQNDGDTTDSDGRYPHSVEGVVSCEAVQSVYEEVAAAIFKYKAAGINTYGNTAETVTGNNGESITVRFTIPTALYIWWKLDITTRNVSDEVPEDEVKQIIISYISSLASGSVVVPQEMFGTLYSRYPFITYIDVLLCSTDSPTPAPSGASYTYRSIALTQRQRAETTTDMISFT